MRPSPEVQSSDHPHRRFYHHPPVRQAPGVPAENPPTPDHLQRDRAVRPHPSPDMGRRPLAREGETGLPPGGRARPLRQPRTHRVAEGEDHLPLDLPFRPHSEKGSTSRHGTWRLVRRPASDPPGFRLPARLDRSLDACTTARPTEFEIGQVGRSRSVKLADHRRTVRTVRTEPSTTYCCCCCCCSYPCTGRGRRPSTTAKSSNC